MNSENSSSDDETYCPSLNSCCGSDYFSSDEDSEEVTSDKDYYPSSESCGSNDEEDYYPSDEDYDEVTSDEDYYPSSESSGSNDSDYHHRPSKAPKPTKISNYESVTVNCYYPFVHIVMLGSILGIYAMHMMAQQTVQFL